MWEHKESSEKQRLGGDATIGRKKTLPSERERNLTRKKA